MRPNSIVVVGLHTPREKFWGQLLEINSAGITVRGLDLSTFNEWLNQLGVLLPLGSPQCSFPFIGWSGSRQTNLLEKSLRWPIPSTSRRVGPFANT